MTAIRKAIESFAASIPEKKRVLDVGCGLKPYESYFSHCTYIGIDVAESGREASNKTYDYAFDGVNIPFENGSYDVVLCTEVLEHAINPSALLKEMHRVLKLDGVLFLTVPFIWGLHEVPYDFRRYTIFGIKTELENAKFEVCMQEKLTSGIDAIEMLMASEINNFMRHLINKETADSFRFRLIMRLQQKLFHWGFFILRKNVIFERIYIDNLVIAKKINMETFIS